MRRLVLCALVLTLVPVLDLLSLWGAKHASTLKAAQLGASWTMR